MFFLSQFSPAAWKPSPVSLPLPILISHSMSTPVSSAMMTWDDGTLKKAVLARGQLPPSCGPPRQGGVWEVQARTSPPSSAAPSSLLSAGTSTLPSAALTSPPSTGTSTPPSAALPSPPSAGKLTPPSVANASPPAVHMGSLPVAAPSRPVPTPRKHYAVPAPPEHPPVPAPRQRPPGPVPPVPAFLGPVPPVPASPGPVPRPQVSTPPERPQKPAPPERPQEPASFKCQTETTSNFQQGNLGGGGSMAPALEAGGWGRGLGGGPALASWIPWSAMASQAPRSTVGPGTGAALEAFRPRTLPLEASSAPTPHNVRPVFPMSCVSLPLVPLFGLPVPVLVLCYH